MKTPERKRPDMNVPRNIMVAPSSPLSDLEPEITDRDERKARLKSDYERLVELLEEQSEIMDKHTRAGADDPSPESSTVADRLPSSMHPLIAASDLEFQQAFDALARDSVFDDNFENAFNEFSEHYLALSPWSEEDSMENKDEGHNSSGRDYSRSEQDSIQIPLTPVSRKDLTKTKHSKSVGSHHVSRKERPRTPTLGKGILNSSSLESKNELSDLRSGENFVEISRRPLYRRATSLKKSDPDTDESPGSEFIHIVRKPPERSSRNSSSAEGSNEQDTLGELKSSWAHLHESPEEYPSQPAPKETGNSSGHRRRERNLLRRKR